MDKLRGSNFLKDESGAGTIMGLLWFILLVGITGMAVDTTNGFRMKTMLQATADAASLAAVQELPDEVEATLLALEYAEKNMPLALHGQVLQPKDIQFGIWDAETRVFTVGETPADTVRVLVHRTEDSGNAVPVNFLRIAGLDLWNVSAQAIAHQFVTGCLGDGLFSRQMVNISSNNSFVQNICIHGEEGVDMQNDNYFETGVIVGMPDTDTMLTTPNDGLDGNPGLEDALQDQSLGLEMIDDLPDIIAKFKDPSLDIDEPPVIPDYIDTSLPVILATSAFDFATIDHEGDEELGYGRIFHFQCAEMTSILIPAGIELRDLVIVADCRINVGSNAKLRNVVLASSATGNGVDPLDLQNISFASNVELGKTDNCEEGGGVQIYSAASVHFSSTMLINGLQVVAAGSVELGARDMGIWGISVQAGRDITLTANNEFGLCSGGADGVFTHRDYHLVR